MNAIARTLGVSRSNLTERASKLSKPRGPYRKADDMALLAELRPIIDQIMGDRPDAMIGLAPTDTVLFRAFMQDEAFAGLRFALAEFITYSIENCPEQLRSNLAATGVDL